MRRVAITTYFLEAMDTPSTHEDREMTTCITKDVMISCGSDKWIGAVISEVQECAKTGVEYSDKSTRTINPTLHVILLDLFTAHTIAKAMVDDCGIRQGHLDVMDWLRRRRKNTN